MLYLQKHNFNGFILKYVDSHSTRKKKKTSRNRLILRKGFSDSKYYDAQHMLALKIHLIADFLMMILMCC